MRLPVRFARYRRIVLTLVAIAVVGSTAWAQRQQSPTGDMSTGQAIGLDEEVETLANLSTESPIGITGGSAVEAAPAVPIQPQFGGPLLERPKLTGDWLGWRSQAY
ncbi:hypothetical protein Psta_1164 [Pirellula staleyi DSM 6068]|uniref:Uncharacterized protein n=1 Tax=Pirellula staleyi (strain ATCC 27377 / DSM 6068 / ICPB 4128) TaxID=530564 RepID=D2R918_PIRSD|nr:hypothetical protein Psta_1164 [Pirellula staleyi DSM 6068]